MIDYVVYSRYHSIFNCAQEWLRETEYTCVKLRHWHITHRHVGGILNAHKNQVKTQKSAEKNYAMGCSHTVHFDRRIILHTSGSRTNFEKGGGRKTIYKLRPHLSQRNICLLHGKSGFLKKYEPLGAAAPLESATAQPVVKVGRGQYCNTGYLQNGDGTVVDRMSSLSPLPHVYKKVGVEVYAAESKLCLCCLRGICNERSLTESVHFLYQCDRSQLDTGQFFEIQCNKSAYRSNPIHKYLALKIELVNYVPLTILMLTFNRCKTGIVKRS